MKVISIDPGYERVGIAVLEKNNGGKETVLFSECFRTSKELPHFERLKAIGNEIRSVIKKYSPDALAIETLFFNTNQKTAMMVSEARGMMLYECAQNNLEIAEFTPLQIKVAVTGHGRSDKSSVIKMIPLLVELKSKPELDDEYDAIAVGLTYFAHKR